MLETMNQDECIKALNEPVDRGPCMQEQMIEFAEIAHNIKSKDSKQQSLFEV